MAPDPLSPFPVLCPDSLHVDPCLMTPSLRPLFPCPDLSSVLFSIPPLPCHSIPFLVPTPVSCPPIRDPNLPVLLPPPPSLPSSVSPTPVVTLYPRSATLCPGASRPDRNSPPSFLPTPYSQTLSPVPGSRCQTAARPLFFPPVPSRSTSSPSKHPSPSPNPSSPDPLPLRCLSNSVRPGPLVSEQSLPTLPSQ